MVIFNLLILDLIELMFYNYLDLQAINSYSLKEAAMSMFTNVNVVSQNVSNWDRARRFYRETLGWPVVFSSDEAGWEEYGLENAAHVSITLWRGPEPPILMNWPL